MVLYVFKHFLCLIKPKKWKNLSKVEFRVGIEENCKSIFKNTLKINFYAAIVQK